MACKSTKFLSIVCLLSYILCCLCEECLDCTNGNALDESSRSIEEMKGARIEHIKRKILQKLRLSEPPTIPSHSALPNVINVGDILEEPTPVSENGGDDYYATTENIILFPVEISTISNPDPLVLSTTMRFQMDPVKDFSQGKPSAHLWIYIPQQNKFSVTYVLYDIRPNSTAMEQDHILHVDHVSNTSFRDWRKYDVTRILSNWLSGDLQRTFTIECNGCSNDPIGTIKNIRPFVTINADTSQHLQRKKRNVKCSADSSHCCRQDFYLSFADLKWDSWIIAPTGYKANFCSGDCDYDQKENQFNYTDLVQDSQRRSKFKDCCTPSKLSSISILYQGNDHILRIGTLSDMVVEACHCP